MGKLFSKILRAFVFFAAKKANANKSFSTFAKATVDKGKRRWGSAVAQGYGGTSWGRGKEPFLQKFFSSSQSTDPYWEQSEIKKGETRKGFIMRKFLMLSVAAASLLILAGCSDSPKQVTRKWHKAILAGDLNTANKLSTSNTAVLNAIIVEMVKDKNNETVKKNVEQSLKNINSAQEKITGDTAEVSIEGANKPIQLKKVEGEWKVDVKKN